MPKYFVGYLVRFNTRYLTIARAPSPIHSNAVIGLHSRPRYRVQ